MNPDIITIVVTFGLVLITFCVTRKVLREFSSIQPPWLIAGGTALLAGAGLFQAGDGIAGLILLPFSALALTLPVLLLLRWMPHGLFSKRPVRHFRNISEFKKPERTKKPGPLADPAKTIRNYTSRENR